MKLDGWFYRILGCRNQKPLLWFLHAPLSRAAAVGKLWQLRPIAWTCTIALLFASIGLSQALAQDAEASPWEKGAIQIGGFVTTFESELTFGASGFGNAKIDGEDRLGLDTHLTLLRVDAMFRPGRSRRNQVDAGYAGYDRTGDTSLSQTLTIGRATYPVGAEVETVFNFDLIRATYSYAFLQNSRARVALGLGAYGVPLRYNLTIQSLRGSSVVKGADTILPFPTLALRSEFRVLPKLFVKASVDGMYLAVSGFEGSLLDASVSLEYRLWKHLGVGLGYNLTDAHVHGKTTDSNYPGVDFVGQVDVRFSGLLFYGKVSF
jgi:hypothetical protein